MSNRATAHKRMRPLVIDDLPEPVQRLIKKRGWSENISYEKAVAEFLVEASDAAIVDAWVAENRGNDDDDDCLHAECCRRTRLGGRRDDPF